jgi:hypothetical protein
MAKGGALHGGLCGNMIDTITASPVLRPIRRPSLPQDNHILRPLPPPPSARVALYQVEADRVALYVLLLSVPSKVVKHLQRVAQAGYDKTRVQLGAAQGGAADAEEQEAGNAEVRGTRALCLSGGAPLIVTVLCLL